jgi:hypothetical protein
MVVITGSWVGEKENRYTKKRKQQKNMVVVWKKLGNSKHLMWQTYSITKKCVVPKTNYYNMIAILKITR